MFGNEGGDNMVFDDKYKDYLEHTYSFLDHIHAESGWEAQCLVVHDTDEDQLTERERLLMMLPVIKYEIDHDMLTPELKDELDLYHEDVMNGKFDGQLGDDEEEIIKRDLCACYQAVFEK